MTIRIASALLVSSLTVAACGGGGGGAESPATATSNSGGSSTPITATQIALFDQTATEKTRITAHQIDSTAGTVSQSTGTLDHGINQFSLGGWTGTLDKTTGAVALSGGGTATVEKGTTKHVAFYTAEASGENPVFGVVGQATNAADLPTTGSASYAGQSQVTIVDSVATFDLTGTSRVDVDFSRGNASVTMTDLDGTRTTGISSPAMLTDVATVTITDMNVTGGTFSGGTTAVSSPYVLGNLTPSAVTQTSGGLYGPTANEVGGVFRTDDSAAGDLLVQGAFVGEQ
ncbi:MAG: transferrin-binding protein-like solute binding protein [Pseudomonadota bacterium]